MDTFDICNKYPLVKLKYISSSNDLFTNGEIYDAVVVPKELYYGSTQDGDYYYPGYFVDFKSLHRSGNMSKQEFEDTFEIV